MTDDSNRIEEEDDYKGKKVLYRHPTMDDAEDILEYTNSIIEEGKYFVTEEKLSLEEEKENLKEVIERVEENKTVFILLEVDGKVVGGASVSSKKGRMAHMGDIGMGIKKGFRGRGFGTKLLKITIEKAKEKINTKIFIADSVFGNNKRAINLYKKLGFKEIGRIEKGLRLPNDKYTDHITFVKRVSDLN